MPNELPLTLAEVLYEELGGPEVLKELEELREKKLKEPCPEIAAGIEDGIAEIQAERDWEERKAKSEQVVADIYAAIHILAESPARCRAALCLSGGGIRSATFNLGILQGLARHKLLDRITYLSTVSGGGFIGGWLSAWVRRMNGD